MFWVFVGYTHCRNILRYECRYRDKDLSKKANLVSKSIEVSFQTLVFTLQCLYTVQVMTKVLRVQRFILVINPILGFISIPVIKTQNIVVNKTKFYFILFLIFLFSFSLRIKSQVLYFQLCSFLNLYSSFQNYHMVLPQASPHHMFI